MWLICGIILPLLATSYSQYLNNGQNAPAGLQNGQNQNFGQLFPFPSFGQPQQNQQFGPQNQQFGPQLGPLQQQPQFGPQGQQYNQQPIDFTNYFSKLFNPDSAYPNSLPEIDVPDLTQIAYSCPKESFFYSFNPRHREAIVGVKDIIMSYNTTADRLAISNALRARPEINPKVWYYALSSCSLNDPELQRIRKPRPVEVMPDVFINAETFRKCMRESPGFGAGASPAQPGPLPQPQPFGTGTKFGYLPSGFRDLGESPGDINSTFGRRDRRQIQEPPQCVQLDSSIGADNGAENLLWYFREDIQLNSHHWYWHLEYSPNAPTRADRRGELFYYVHSNILARYDAERFSNGLSRTVAFNPGENVNIAQGYNAHLADTNSQQVWTDRRWNVPFTDCIHESDPNLGINVFVRDQILTAIQRLDQSIQQGVAWPSQGDRIPLFNTGGIDVLGDLIQSNSFSINPTWYGLGDLGLHNSGHVIISEAMDPTYQTRSPPGPMADTATSMRDPIFYQWHSLINNVFDSHKQTLIPYAVHGGEHQLLWPGIQIVSISIQPFGNGNTNQLRTFWNTIQFPFNRGLDFGRPANSNPINICSRILDHQEFTYRIILDKARNIDVNRATVRIFLAPRFDERGNRFTMLQQRGLFFTMDTFVVNLSQGRNTIIRNSTQSALTIPWSQTLQEQNQDSSQETPYCGCGWPHHLLLPKGTSNGMIFDLFIMITPGADLDSVRQTRPPPNCINAPIQCGVPNGLYFDLKPMGYPFDRLPYSVNGRIVQNLEEYESSLTNVAVIQVTITSEN